MCIVYHIVLFHIWIEIFQAHYCDVIMTTMVSQITSLTIVYSIVYSDADQRKHQSSASLAFVRGIHRRPVNSPHKGPVTRKKFPFDDVIMQLLYYINYTKWSFDRTFGASLHTFGSFWCILNAHSSSWCNFFVMIKDSYNHDWISSQSDPSFLFLNFSLHYYKIMKNWWQAVESVISGDWIIVTHCLSFFLSTRFIYLLAIAIDIRWLNC